VPHLGGTEDPPHLQEVRKLLRLFLNDTPELNRLIRQEESDATHLDLALRLAIDDYNITTPLLGAVSVSSFPSIYLLIHGAAIQTLKMNGILQSRNELNYSSGGVTVRTFDKTQLYQSWIALFLQDYERKKMNFKIAQNIEGAFGHGFASEYSTIAWFW
jgi:hypothetical protein